MSKQLSKNFIVQTELFVNYFRIDWYDVDDNDSQSVLLHCKL